MCADLIGKNKYVNNALSLFIESIEEGRQSLTNRHNGEGVSYLETIRDFFGEFCEKGLLESDAILNQLFANREKSG